MLDCLDDYDVVLDSSELDPPSLGTSSLFAWCTCLRPDDRTQHLDRPSAASVTSDALCDLTCLVFWTVVVM